MGTFADLKNQLKNNPEPPKLRSPPPPATLSQEVLAATRAAAAAANIYLRSGKSPADTLRALDVLTSEMLGSQAAAHKRVNETDYPHAENAVKRLTGSKETDLALVKNHLLKVILFVFQEETGGVFRVRLHHANELVAAIQGELG
jgi:hypothetical protein